MNARQLASIGLVLSWIASHAWSNDDAKKSPNSVSVAAAEGNANDATKTLPNESLSNAKSPTPAGSAHDEKSMSGEDSSTLPGHSYHGEVFNEGPRQAAYLMQGIGNAQMKITTINPMAQRFFDQGLGQLHGFWYFESERSFRQAAAFDKNCAMAYWGMAMSNMQNESRARGFIRQAMQHRETCQTFEKKWIEALNRRLDGDKKDSPKGKSNVSQADGEDQNKEDQNKPADKDAKKQRLERYVKDLEELATENPDQIELKAFLAAQIWENDRAEIRIQSHLAVNALLEEVFRSNPRHPAHHYRIHLWDYKKAENALAAAAACGPSAPGVAHMWHMPGHIYSRLHRYQDAAWQQEASARVDHAHMMRDAILPDRIHNFAHNNEWFIRNLIHVARVRDALSLARNMIELPRHPKYNTFTKRGSSSYGRERLMGVLTEFRLWPELIELSDTMYLDPTDDEGRQDERLTWRAIAANYVGDVSLEKSNREELQRRLETVKARLKELDNQRAESALRRPSTDSNEDVLPLRPPVLENPDSIADEKNGEDSDQEGEKDSSQDKSDKDLVENDKMTTEEKEVVREIKRLRGRRNKLENHLTLVDAHVQAKRGKYQESLKLARKIGRAVDPLTKAEWTLATNPKESLKLIAAEIKKSPGQVLPLAISVHLAWLANDRELAKQRLEALLPLVSVADKDTPLLARLQPIIEAFELQPAWNAAPVMATDLGDRPDLDALGPYRWSPSIAPNWSLMDSQGKAVSMQSLRGKPVVMLFYLGFGCLHCVEQLKEYSPQVQEFREAGFEVVAISSEKPDSLQKALLSYKDTMNVRLIANPELDVFRAYRCFDDFEGQPLHGTFVIDGKGRVLWQDIGHEPFQDAKFVMNEGKRLLSIP